MGFESAYAARRRLAALAMSGEPGEALSPSLFAGNESFESVPEEGNASLSISECVHLDELAHDIIAIPGAGGALLAVFAAQARALSLVLEAAVRTQDAALLPAEVMRAVQSALHVPPAVAGLQLAWRR